MGKTLSTNQASLILILFTVALKLSVLPAITYDYAEKNAYVVSFIALMFNFLLTFLIITIMQKIPQKNFFELIKETLSKPVAIIIYILLFLYFFPKLIISLLELHDYYIVALFENLNPLYFIITILFFLLFMFNKNFRSIGRLLEVCFWPMALGIMFTLIFPVQEIQLFNLFPILENGIFPVANGLFKTTFAYGDYMILFVLMGNIKYSPKATKKILLYLSSILGFVFNFYVIFVGTFGSTSVNQSLALSELPLLNPSPSTMGRLEWLSIIMWTAILLLQASILGLCCVDCFNKIFDISDNKISSFVILVGILIIYFIGYLKLQIAIKISLSLPMIIFCLSLQTICIMILCICFCIQHRKNKPPNKEIVRRKQCSKF